MKRLFTFMSWLLIVTLIADAQEYKIRQVTSVNEMKIEMTKYVKGSRERTEQGAIMGIGGNIATITQCDLKRTITLNTKKKNYRISEFGAWEDAFVETGAPVKKSEPRKAARKGGTIEMWFNINDTGERKKMFGFTARHIWTTQKIYPSKDACDMRDSVIMKTDGWYIDLAGFNCVSGGGRRVGGRGDGGTDCEDKIITHVSGKAKMGFPLFLTTTIITRDSRTGKEVEFKTTIETLELSTAKLDSMLFTIPPGYSEAKSDAELQEEYSVKDIQKIKDADENAAVTVAEEKTPGVIRIGVLVPEGNTEVDAELLQRKLLNKINNLGLEAVGVTTDEEARKYQCDYVLNSVLKEVKSSSNVGGIIKAIRKRDPNAVSNFKVEGNIILRKLSDGSVKNEKAIDGKYDGSQTEAAAKALEENCAQLLMILK